MTITALRRLLLAGALGTAALSFGTVGAAGAGTCGGAGANGCNGDQPGEAGYDEALLWLVDYEEELETTYGQSDNDTYGECETGVMAGPGGEGDFRPGAFPR